MDSKRFISELQKRSGLERGRLRSLMKALGEVIRLRAMALEPLDVASLGRFEGRKRMEFEYEERMSGRTLLYPPHIGLRFAAARELLDGPVPTLEAQASLNAWLKRTMADMAACEPAFAAVCLDAMICIVAEAMRRSEEVEVPGLGVWRVVSTGRSERRRVVCTVAPELREDVNAPFAGFEPVVIRQGRPQAATVADRPEPVAEIGTSGVEPIAPPVVNSLEGGAEALPVIDNYTLEDTDMKQNPDAAPSDDVRPTAEGEAADKQQYDEAIRQAEDGVDASDGNGRMSQRIEQIIEEDDADEVEATGSRRSMLIAVIILLAVAILGTGIYFAYRVHQNEKEAEATDGETTTIVSQAAAPTESEGATALDAIAAAATSAGQTDKTTEPTAGTEPATASASSSDASSDASGASSASAEAEAVRSESPQAATDAGFPKRVTLRSGERLTLLALRYYGSKFFWVYIYEANKARYADPDNIPAGADLIIPAPGEFGIDASNPASIERAKALAAGY